MVRHESSAQRVIEQPAGEVLDARQVEAACARKVAHECLVRCHVEENAPLKGQPFNGTRLSRSQTTRSSPFKGGMISYADSCCALAPAPCRHTHVPRHSHRQTLCRGQCLDPPRAIFIYSLASSRSHHRHRRRGSFSSTRRDSASSTTIERQRSHSMRLTVSGWKTCVRL